MRTILRQSWEAVVYGKSGVKEFAHWSNLVLGEGDKSLKPSRSSMLGPINWFLKHLRWKKYIVLLPKAEKDAEFRMRFYSLKFKLCKISSVARKTSDGPFAMRMGPEDCHFFVVANEKVGVRGCWLHS